MSQWKSHCVNTSIKPMDLDLKINLKFETIFLTAFRNAQFFYTHIILLMQWLSTVLNAVTEHYACTEVLHICMQKNIWSGLQYLIFRTFRINSDWIHSDWQIWVHGNMVSPICKLNQAQKFDSIIPFQWFLS